MLPSAGSETSQSAGSEPNQQGGSEPNQSQQSELESGVGYTVCARRGAAAAEGQVCWGMAAFVETQN